MADVLSAVTFDEPAEPDAQAEQKNGTEESEATPKAEAPEDLDAFTERLAEEIASGVEGDEDDPASPETETRTPTQPEAEPETGTDPPAKPRTRVVRTRPGPDASLDRLVDRHIDASLPDQGAAPGRDAETGRGSRR